MTFMTLSKYSKNVRSPMLLLLIEYARSINYLTLVLPVLMFLWLYGGDIAGLIAEGGLINC